MSQNKEHYHHRSEAEEERGVGGFFLVVFVFFAEFEGYKQDQSPEKRGSSEELEVTFNVKMEERAVKEEVDSDETPSGEAN